MPRQLANGLVPVYSFDRSLLTELPLSEVLRFEAKGLLLAVRRRKDGCITRAYIKSETIPPELFAWLATSNWRPEILSYRSGASWLLKRLRVVDGVTIFRRWPGT